MEELKKKLILVCVKNTPASGFPDGIYSLELTFECRKPSGRTSESKKAHGTGLSMAGPEGAEGTSKKKGAVGGETSKDKGAVGGETSKDKGAVGGETSKDKGAVGGETSKDKGAVGGETSKDKGAVGGETSKDKGAVGGETSKDKGAVGGETSKDKGAVGGETSKDKGAVGGETSKDKGAVGGETSKDKGAAGGETSKDKGAAGEATEMYDVSLLSYNTQNKRWEVKDVTLLSPIRKTVYNPAIWPDKTLEERCKEAFINAISKNKVEDESDKAEPNFTYIYWEGTFKITEDCDKTQCFWIAGFSRIKKKIKTRQRKELTLKDVQDYVVKNFYFIHKDARKIPDCDDV
uniref:Uncharacterized protein n=1 Tax=Branchiostoma floridae TaxID=7739 RepID=C3Z0M3_BRAFL|eukprot:XP_002597891.1 hypothetical protein BRAFLDRAFT_97878 [Branchiostoma floridae]